MNCDRSETIPVDRRGSRRIAAVDVRHDTLTSTQSEPVAVVRNWREAASLLEAACAEVARHESPETLAIQDAANCKATMAFAALAAVQLVHPDVLRGHADALLWLIDSFGALSDDPHYATLGRSIAAELLTLAELLPTLPLDESSPSGTDGR